MVDKVEVCIEDPDNEKGFSLIKNLTSSTNKEITTYSKLRFGLDDDISEVENDILPDLTRTGKRFTTSDLPRISTTITKEIKDFFEEWAKRIS